MLKETSAMKKMICLAAGMVILACGFQAVRAQDKTRSLKVNVKYGGSGPVDDKHKIQVFLFDSPDFAQGNAMPIGMQATATKNGTVTFGDIGKSPVYAAAVYDPSG